MFEENGDAAELKAVEACPGDKVAFSLPETAKILGRSVKWARQKTADGKLKSVWVGGQRRVTRPTLVRALTEAVQE
jgi:hypothetical protein